MPSGSRDPIAARGTVLLPHCSLLVTAEQPLQRTVYTGDDADEEARLRVPSREADVPGAPCAPRARFSYGLIRVWRTHTATSTSLKRTSSRLRMHSIEAGPESPAPRSSLRLHAAGALTTWV